MVMVDGDVVMVVGVYGDDNDIASVPCLDIIDVGVSKGKEDAMLLVLS
jgi:hypothetical protein